MGVSGIDSEWGKRNRFSFWFVKFEEFVKIIRELLVGSCLCVFVVGVLVRVILVVVVNKSVWV